MRDAAQTSRIDQDRAAISDVLGAICRTAATLLGDGVDPTDAMLAPATELVDMPHGTLALFLAEQAVREAEKRL